MTDPRNYTKDRPGFGMGEKEFEHATLDEAEKELMNAMESACLESTDEIYSKVLDIGVELGFTIGTVQANSNLNDNEKKCLTANLYNVRDQFKKLLEGD